MMVLLNRILYYGVLIPISLLPYPVLYLISDVLFFFVYRVFGYRKTVVHDNITRAFPEKSREELKKLEKGFYHYFCDLIVESIKNFTISEKQANKRMIAVNPELFDSYRQNNQSIIFCGGHYNNWELWAVSFPLKTPYKIAGIYKKLSNAFFNKKMLETRAKFGLNLVETKEISNEYFSNSGPIGTVFAFDQSPHKPDKAYWLKFLGRDTACFYGPEKYAKERDMPVVFGHIKRIRRGYYETWYEPLFDHPKNTEYGEITEKINQVLEKDIREAPEFWLWSHKRWKHTKDQP